MIKQLSALTLLGALFLTGCRSPAAPVLAATAPRTLSDQQVRRVLALGPTSIWGLAHTQRFDGDFLAGKAGYKFDLKVRWTSNYSTPDATPITRLSHNRYMYKVPADRALVLNRIDGRGSVFINGYEVPVKTYFDGVRNAIHYVFGPGEEIVLNFAPEFLDGSASDRIPGSIRYAMYTTYHPLSLTGFTIDPSLLGSMGLDGGK